MPPTDPVGDALGYAEERRRTLAEEVSKLDTFIVAAKALFGGAPAPRVELKKAEPIGMDAATMLEVVDQMLTVHGQPMPVAYIYRKFREHGHQIGGRDEVQTFSKRISRAKHLFVMVPGRGVWRVGHSCADAGYAPEAKPASDGEAAEEPHPAPPALPVPNIRDAYDHFNLLDDDECACALCGTWRQQRAMAETLAPTVVGHGRSCKCEACVEYRHASVGLWAAVNRRDLWIEMSYHALHDDEMTEPVMHALWTEISGDAHNVNWWAINGNRFPVGYWLRKARMHTLTAATGLVSTVVAVSGFASVALRDHLRKAYTAVAPASWMNEVTLEMDTEAA